MIATFATRRVLASYCVHSWFDKIFIHSELRNEWTVRGQFRLMVRVPLAWYSRDIRNAGGSCVQNQMDLC